MLIFTRKIGESFMIGEGDDVIKITYLRSQHGKAVLGITANKHVPIHREEIYNKIHGKK